MSGEAAKTVFARKALLPGGWAENVVVMLDGAGEIASVVTDQTQHDGSTDQAVGILLPAPGNLHSHAFQRAMAGMSEHRGQASGDSFWTWRRIMFRFLDTLTPDDVEAIAAFVQMEMLEAGYAAVGEFHYLHHQPGGRTYGNLAEMSDRIIAAADRTGIGLTLLPVLYQYGGCDRRGLSPGQIRFGNDVDRFTRLYEAARAGLARLPADARIGVAPHSLRAVDADGLRRAVALAGPAPLHIHVAEQTAEVEEVRAATGKRPVEGLLSAHDVGANWCLIHCTQMTPAETVALARSGAVAGLCPITEANLGDGIFDAVRYVAAGGRFGIGSDSNIRISLSEELRGLDYSQRLRDHSRAALATPDKSTGRVLFDMATSGGAQALGRNGGTLAPGQLADLVALDAEAIDLDGRTGDEILDAFIFTGDDRLVTDVWSAGRHVVTEGRHRAADAIRARYRETMRDLRQRL